MTAPLEIHYRRLLAAYPAAHRRAYEEEMVGVLMEGAEPGRRRPTAGETADLVWSGLTARLGRGLAGLRGAVWREAAAVAALIGVVLLAVVAVRRLIFGLTYLTRYDDPMRFLGVDGGLLVDVAARSAAWLAVLVAVLVAARRTALGLAVVALLVEVAAIAVWQPGQEFRIIRMSWVVALAALTLALLVLSRHSRAATAILRRPGTAPIGRFLVLLAPLLAIPFAQQLVEQVINISVARFVTPGMVLVTVLLMVAVPALAFGLAAAVLNHRFEAGRGVS